MDPTHTSCSGDSAGTNLNNEQKNNENSSNNPDNDENDKPNEENTKFECNICLDIAKDAVVSMCGHLFCWPCLHQWLDTKPNRPLCPVCKSAISKEKVIPLYGRGGKESDPRDKCPPRPRGQRTEDTSTRFPGGFHWGNDGGHGGVQFSLGIGVFPISFFASFFNNAGVGTERRNESQLQLFNVGGGQILVENSGASSMGSRQHAEEQFLSNIFLYVGMLFVLWLIFF